MNGNESQATGPVTQPAAHRPSTLRVMRPDFPFRPSAFPFYYGWIVLFASTVGLVMSAPGQTIGVSVVTESCFPMPAR